VWVCLYIPENMYSDLISVFGVANTIIKFKGSGGSVYNIYCWHK
jgi:hypothetical protein